MLDEGKFEKLIQERYSSYSTGIGKEIEEGRASFKTLSDYALKLDTIVNQSGRQELLESMLNQYIFE